MIVNPNGAFVYCDLGPCAGMWRVRGTIYLTDEEHTRLQAGLPGNAVQFEAVLHDADVTEKEGEGCDR